MNFLTAKISLCVCSAMVVALLSGCEPVPEGHESQGFSILVPKRAPESLTATETYGALVVREGEFETEALKRPWSGYWYPADETDLFESKVPKKLSPLQKYDALAKKQFSRETHAAEYEKKRHNPAATAPWAGLCDAWSAASVLEPEPRTAKVIDGVSFGIADQKALLIKTYENAEGKRIYGNRNDGDRKSIYDDIYPDQFHRLLQAELFDRRRPIIMDRDPRPPVWNTPVWGVKTRVFASSESPHVMRVETTVYVTLSNDSALDEVKPVNTHFDYTYDLYGYAQKNGDFKVIFGDWTGKSADFHPDFATVLDEPTIQKSRNPEIDPEIVNFIVGS